MENYKVSYFKYDDPETLVEKLKDIMEEYDMYLIGIDENRYKFDKDRSYSRSFTIEPAPNGWIAILDEEVSQAEELSQELSQSLSCFTLNLGIQKNVLRYTVFENGEQTGQYMSSLKYYEYEIDDEVEEIYKGDAEVFTSVLGSEEIQKLQEILDGCKEGEIDSEDAFRSILVLNGIIEVKNEEKDQDNGEDEDEEEDTQRLIVNPDLFYVDFESISIKTGERDKIVDAIEEIAGQFGFSRVEEFKSYDENKKGFFKKMINSISESKRLKFFISPSSEGWVTLCGEIERLKGSEPVEWNFMHIEDKLSDITGDLVVNISANPESWGFKVFRDSKVVCSYNSNDDYDLDSIAGIFDGMDRDWLEDILDRPLVSAVDVDKVLEEFCGALKISDYKINIPMDFSEEEYYETVIKRLPGGSDFLYMKFVEDK